MRCSERALRLARADRFGFLVGFFTLHLFAQRPSLSLIRLPGRKETMAGPAIGSLAKGTEALGPAMENVRKVFTHPPSVSALSTHPRR